MDLNSAGNVLIPAYLSLRAKGYSVTSERSNGSEKWIAEGSLGRFVADCPITLLGVVAVAETRGDSWRATDAEIDAFFKEFGLPQDS